LNEKRNSAAAIDTIKAEDVGKFPDSNLAESMQRVPGIALARAMVVRARIFRCAGLARPLPAFV
jgi:outer membrane receptor for ferrienterochelin and colicin